MVWFGLLLEGYHLVFKHEVSIKNAAADGLSRLEIVQKPSNKTNWGISNQQVVYKKNRANNKLCKAMVAMNYPSSAIVKILDHKTNTDAAE